jgi:serine/threonine protein phosphatase PrpC
MRIEIGPVMALGPRETLLLATDGLFDNLTNADVINGLRKGDLESGVQGLVGLARNRRLDDESDAPSKPDDLSMIAVRSTLRA